MLAGSNGGAVLEPTDPKRASDFRIEIVTDEMMKSADPRFGTRSSGDEDASHRVGGFASSGRID